MMSAPSVGAVEELGHVSSAPESLSTVLEGLESLLQRLSEASDAAIEDEETLLRKDENTRQISLEKRRYALRELVDTEKSYIRELEKIVFGYMEVIRSGSIEVPKDLMRGKIGFVFGNIQEIHEFHKEHLLPRLEACLEKPEHLGTVFKQ